MKTSTKLRLDQFLVDFHGYESRSKARDAIKRGCVTANGKLFTKSGQTIETGTFLQIEDDARHYVSRSALKLVHALDQMQIDPAGLVALDLGASTGGFAQVLLERNVAKIFCVDVGSGQLHPNVSCNPQIISIENLNARELKLEHLNNEHPEIIVSDLSFISLKLALPPSLEIADQGAIGVFLIKPQFEVGKSNLGSGGIVRDQTLIKRTVLDLRNWMDVQLGWRVLDIIDSPIEGGDGNKEFLMIAQKDELKEILNE